jgi:hypothetical protein
VLLVGCHLHVVQACGIRAVLLGIGRLDSADEGSGLHGEAVSIGQRQQIARCDRHSHGKVDQAIVRVTTMRKTANAQTRGGSILGGREGHKTRSVFFDTI